VVTVIVIVVAAALLVAITWWMAQPKLGERALDAETPLPLFSSRVREGTEGDQPRVEPAEVAMLRRRAAHAPARTAESGDDGGASPARYGGADGNGYGARSRTPTAPQQAVVPDAAAPSARPELDTASSSGAGGALPSPVPSPAGTIQFLPGRLEVVQGLGVTGQEVRFIRPGRGEEPVVTFGRVDGPPYRHVQLRAPTVSRLHARLTLVDGATWMLENLSTTNPVVLNGEEIPDGGPARALADGDRIEMGEVVFRFRTR
jgi:hypothetical protein